MAVGSQPQTLYSVYCHFVFVLSMTHPKFDVAVIGAGIAGLTCAQRLSETGYRVVVLEKSRGVGGRVATRRLQGTCADHGACYLSPKGRQFRDRVQHWLEAGVLQVWTDTVHELDANGQLHASPLNDRTPRYAPETGMTAIAKSIAAGLDIRFSQRVHSLQLTDAQAWQLSMDQTDAGDEIVAPIVAKAVVVAIPAPQAVPLLQPFAEMLSSEAMQRLQSVRFWPCLSAIAGYPLERQKDWLDHYSELRAVTFTQHSDIAWLGLDSSKRTSSSHAVFVVQSTAAFAERYLEATDLQTAGAQLLKGAAEQLAPWLEAPEWLQVHRWRYAFARSPLSNSYLTAVEAPLLICAGDWCGGQKIERAFLSGLATAEQIRTKMAP